MRLFLALLTAAIVTRAQTNPTTAQSPVSIAETAFQTLQQWYQPSNGLYGTCPSCWWQSANAITTLANLMMVDPNTAGAIQPVLQNTFAVGGNQQGCTNWVSSNYDDAGWWALAWIAAYDATQDQKYLQASESIFDFLQETWGTPCGNGGMWWSDAKGYVNAITNELFMSIAAHLSNRPSSRGAQYYASWAQKSLTWFSQSGMINSKGMINDGLDEQCQNNGRTTFTYNQGVILGALVELYRQSGASQYLDSAHQLASASLAAMTDRNGVLVEECGSSCDADQTQFKGIYMRNLMLLNSIDQRQDYERVIEASAESLWQSDRGQGGVIGVQWEGPFVSNGAGFSTQSSGLDCLVAWVAMSR